MLKFFQGSTNVARYRRRIALWLCLPGLLLMGSGAVFWFAILREPPIDSSLNCSTLPYTDNFSRVDQTGGDFAGKKAPCGDFSEGNFTGADFTGAELWRADFSGSNLTGADFSRADLRGANFSGANLTGTKFANSDTSGADFSRTAREGAE